MSDKSDQDGEKDLELPKASSESVEATRQKECELAALSASHKVLQMICEKRRREILELRRDREKWFASTQDGTADCWYVMTADTRELIAADLTQEQAAKIVRKHNASASLPPLVRGEKWTIEQAGWQSNLVNIACNGQTIVRDVRRQSAKEVIDAHNAALALPDEQALEEKEALADSVNFATQNTSSRYVVGFMFDPEFLRIALIRKNKPEWQAGLLNGIGGKIEPNEEAFDAMIREFREEAGLTRTSWRHFATLSGTNNDGETFELVCYWTTELLGNVRAQEKEQIEVIDVSTIVERDDTIGDLPWLITLARDCGEGVFPPRIVKADYGPSVSDGGGSLAVGVSSPDSSAALPDKEKDWKLAIELLSDVEAGHRDEDSANYNDCDKVPCHWCEQARMLISASEHSAHGEQHVP